MGLILTNNAGGNGRLRLTNSLGTNGRVKIFTSPSSNDPDAQAFITAAGITDPTQQSAINTLVIDLKLNNIWTKMNAIYPFVGGTATTHKYNLKDPQDSNAAYRLQFFGGWTHSANGILPNGVNTYANTFYNLNPIASGHLAIYSRSNTATSSAIDIGTATSAVNRYYLSAGISSTTSPTLGFGNPTILGVSSSTLGFFTGTIISNTSTLYKNGVLIGTSPVSIVSNINSINIGRLSGLGGFHSNRELAFVSMGTGLTSAETLSYYNIVQTFQTSLSRNV